jgi:hypothetical protein
MSNLRSFCASRGGVDISVVAGENISANDCVFIAAYRTNSDTANTSGNAFVCGFVIAAVTTGNVGYIRIAGVMSGFVGLTVGGIYYTNAAAGSIGTTAGASSRIVGFAISSTQILINNRGSQATIYSGASGVSGYSLGGRTATSGSIATSDKIAFSTDIMVACETANLTGSRSFGGFMSKAASHGYSCGGCSTGVTGYTATADKLVYSTSTTAASTNSNLSTTRGRLCGLGNGSTHGYCCGGYSGTTSLTTGDKLTFSNDTLAACATANLSAIRSYTAGLNGTSSKGYVMGGCTGNGSGMVATTDMLTYSTDTIAATATADITTAAYAPTCLSEGSVKGYANGGATAAALTKVTYKLTYSTDTTAASTSANTTSVYNASSPCSEGGNKGYLSGGWISTYTNLAEMIVYATDTTGTKTSANLSSNRQGASGVSDIGW